MPYLGYEPSKVAVTVGQGVIDATHIQDASITTADLGNDSVTPIKVDDDGTGFQMGSLGLGTAVSGSEKLTVGGTASFSGNITGTLATAAQTNITSVGTLTALTVDNISINGTTIGHTSDTDLLTFADAKLTTTGELEIKNGASRRISLNYEDSTNSIISHSGTSYGLESLNIRGDSITFYTDYDSGTPKGNVTLTLDNSHKATFAGEVYVDSYLSLRTTDDQANRWLLYTHTDDTFRMNYNGSGNDELTMDTSGNTTFAGTITVGASNGSEEVKANRTRVRHIDGLADASDYSHGDLYINHISSGNIICSSNVGVGHTTPQYGLTMAQGNADGQKIGWEDGSNNKRGAILVNSSNDAMEFMTGTSDNVRMRIDGAGNTTLGTFSMTNPNTSYKQLNVGGFGVLHREAYDSYLLSNCYYNSSGEFIAKHSHSEGIAGLYFLGGVTSLYSYSGSVTAGTAYTLSERFRFHQSGTLQSGAGAVGATNASNWQSVVKSTTGGTIASGGGMGYFALGDNYTTSDAILMVRNDGNRGSFRHASGSSLIKAQFNDGTAFEVTKDGMIKGMQGAPARIAGNWEVVDVLSAEDNQSSYLQSDNCFHDNIYSQFKIVIPYINCDTANATLLFTFMYNTGSGLTEQTGDYYTSMDISPHTASSYSGGVQSNATRAELFGAMHGHTAVGVSGEMNIYEAFIADLRQYNQFTANTMRSGDGNLDGDRGSNYRPMIDARFLGYNTAYSAYVSQRSMIRCNTDRHASYWKGFRIQASSGNLGAKSQIIVLGRAL